MINTNNELEKVEVNRLKELLNDIHSLFVKSNLKVVDIIKEDKVKEDDIIYMFKIDKKNEPIYENIDSMDDANIVIQEIINSINQLKFEVSSVLTNNADESDESTNLALIGITNAISNFAKVFSKQIIRGFDDGLSGEEIQDKIKDNLINILNQRLIKNIISPLYEGIKFNNCVAYELTIIKVNEFLQNLGVYTINLEKNNKFNFDYVQPEECNDNITKDYNLEETIKDIFQYPYIFDENNIISEARIVVWRFER